MNEKRKTIFGRIFRSILWIAGIWAAALVILQVVLSSGTLNRIVDRFTSEYIDGDLKFETVKVNMFKHFPYAAVIMKNGSLTYPADRFDKLESESVQGLLMYHGCGETADTLASFKHFSVGVDLLSLMRGKINISRIVMVKPRIFAHSYTGGEANWNIFRMPASGADTTEAETSPSTSRTPPSVKIGKIRLMNHPHIVFTSSRDTLFTIIDVKEAKFDGKLNTKDASRNKIRLSMDSMIVAGRLAADTIGVRMQALDIHEHDDHMDIDVEAKTLLATRSFGRIHVPISITGTAAFPKDTVPVIALNGFRAEIAAVPIGFNMTVRMEDNVHVDAEFDIDGCRAEDIIDGFVKNFIPEAKKIRTDASLSLSGTCRGYLGGGKLPDINAELSVPESRISHKDIEHDIRLALGAGISTDMKNRVNVIVNKAMLSTYGLHLTAQGKSSDVLGDDPSISIDGSFKASADSLLTFLPEDSGITAEGDLDIGLKGSMKLSQMDIYNFGQADIEGTVTAEKLILKVPEDTIDVEIEGMSVKVAPEIKKSRKDGTEHRLLAIGGNIRKLNVSFKEAITVKAGELDLAAKNSTDALSSKGSKTIHPLGGHLKATELVIADGHGMSLTLDETLNGFQMVPKSTNPEIPVLSLNSMNRRIYLRNDNSRLILTDSKIHLGAAMNSIERRQKFRAFRDSVAMAHPELPQDSIMPFIRAQRKSRTAKIAVPEWMTEEDFKSQDLNFSLDGIVADYFRQWDIDGKVDVRTGILMTSKLPLRNILKGMKFRFDNNEVRIDSLRLQSGRSEMTAKGSLTGLRRALLGRGIYNMDINLSTKKMDAAEMIAALNAGASIDTDSAEMAEASDSEFLQMVVSDTLDTENVSALIVVPSDLNASIKVDAENVKFSDLLINEFNADVMMKERCMQIVNAKAQTNMGDATFEGFYATRTKKDIKTGFNLELSDITSEKVISMMPSIDTIMPLPKSFRGQLDCEIAATADLDTLMNAIMPSINGVIRISGKNMTMSDNEAFRDLAEMLKFKNRNQMKIGRMTVEGVIKDNTLEVFPFIVDLDRYTLALSGLQNLDMSYRYHASIIQSPIIFKVGVDIYGQDFDNMKFKVGKPKYKDRDIPVFTAVIDETKLNLAASIRSIFEKGVEAAVRENEMQQKIKEHKSRINYINAALMKMEELSEAEQKQLEEDRDRADIPEKIDSAYITNMMNKIILKEIQDNEQSGIH